MKTGIIFKTPAFALLFFLPVCLFSQENLVPNPSFEETIPHAIIKGFAYKTKGRQIVKGWWQPTDGSPEFFNSEHSTLSLNQPVHNARTGKGRVGILVDDIDDPATQNNWDPKEYVQTQLIKPLERGKIYSVNFFIVLDKRSPYATTIGACFSKTEITNESGRLYIDEIPQVVARGIDTIANNTGWSLVHGYYKAEGGEQFLTIGNFGNEHPMSLARMKIFFYREDVMSDEAYYYLDDVSVYEVKDPEKDDYKKLVNQSNATKAFNNLALVLDVSQSMKKDDKIQSLKESVDSLISTLDTNETISVLTFDASPKILARGIKVARRNEIINKIDSLETGGGTNVNSAIKKAYEIIDSTYATGGNNRVILITDAGFNVSRHSHDEIEAYYKEKDVVFSTLIFNDIKYRKLKRICKHTEGVYANVSNNSFKDALNKQVIYRPTEEYTTPLKVHHSSGAGLYVAMCAFLVAFAFIQ
ncbi:MAG TPA: VWA domain-containing protein [Bacteroidia bacterium]|jgi:Mg-chelatase subunit ChlD|nr:VWA domain-containing protein [Bacteroidia bacterium]